MIYSDSGVFYGRKKKKILQKYKVAKSFFDLMRGLIFNNKTPILFIFPKKGFWSIHSFFVFFEFDAIYLDENLKIVDIINNIKPFTTNVSNTSAAKYLLEVPNCRIEFKLNESLSLYQTK